jgi:predicted dehydrogenase
MKKNVSIVLVGIGGYGFKYLSALLDNLNDEIFQVVGAVDLFPDNCERLIELKELNIPIYESIENFYKENFADLAVISSPIHFHCHQTCFALSKGSHVLCEKPLAATVQDAQKIIQVQRETHKHVAIGYQWSFSQGIQDLKNDIHKGLFGKPERLKSLFISCRSEKYYNRNDWAGRKQDNDEKWILDSPINNAGAHFLHNMYYILGEKKETSEIPSDVTAELYRGHKIENFDTVALKSHTESGVEILFYYTHATDKFIGPIFSFEFERAKIIYGKHSKISACFKDGTFKRYNSPFENNLKKLWDTIDAVNNNKPILCGPEAAYSHTLCINGAQESMPDIVDFPESQMEITGQIGNRKIKVKGLNELLILCYSENLLPSELGIIWSKKGKKINLKDYRYFSGVTI